MLLLLLVLLPGLSLPPAKAVRALALGVMHEVMRVAMREGGHEGGGREVTREGCHEGGHEGHFLD